jgi:hypothetical protein
MLTNDLVRLNDKGVARSDNDIAKRCGVTHPYVGKIRASLVTVTSDQRAYTTKHGTTATMNTGAIGKTVPTPSAPRPSMVRRRQTAPEPQTQRRVADRKT